MTAESTIADARLAAILALGLDQQTEAIDSSYLLRLVAKSEYRLSGELIDALQIVASGTNGPASAAGHVMAITAQCGRVQRLSAAVAEFASTFFDIQPTQRCARWRQLHDECRDVPSLVVWLDDLSPGLDIAEVPLATDQINKVVKICCDVFVAKFPDKIRRQQEFRNQYRHHWDVWEPATRELLAQHPLFVAQIAAWLERLGPLKSFEQFNTVEFPASNDQQIAEGENSGVAAQLSPSQILWKAAANGGRFLALFLLITLLGSFLGSIMRLLFKMLQVLGL